MHRLRSVAVVLVAFGLVACDQACTEISVASVTLEVVSAQTDESVDNAHVRFTVDGGQERTPEESSGGSYVLAYEEEGDFDVTVSAPEFETVERSYTVMMDAKGCHVEGVADMVALAAAG